MWFFQKFIFWLSALLLLMFLHWQTQILDLKLTPSKKLFDYPKKVLQVEGVVKHEGDILNRTKYPRSSNKNKTKIIQGSFIVSMANNNDQRYITDIKGSDFRVYQKDENFFSKNKNTVLAPQEYEVLVSNNNSNWHYLGIATGISEFDISNVNLKTVKYIKVRKPKVRFPDKLENEDGPIIEAIEILREK